MNSVFTHQCNFEYPQTSRKLKKLELNLDSETRDYCIVGAGE